MQKRFQYTKALRAHTDIVGKINQRFLKSTVSWIVVSKVGEESPLGNREEYFEGKKSHMYNWYLSDQAQLF